MRLVRLADEENLLLFTMHHIIADGWSLGVLGRELEILYDAYKAGETSPLPEPSIQYADLRYGSANGCRAKCWSRSLITGANS
jgi:hypothetical protein